MKKTGTTRNTDESEVEVVSAGAAAKRTQQAEHHSERDRDERRQRDELPRHRQAVLDHRVDREAAPVQGRAEVERRGVLDVVRELDEPGIVDVPVLAQLPFDRKGSPTNPSGSVNGSPPAPRRSAKVASMIRKRTGTDQSRRRSTNAAMLTAAP